MTSTCWLSASRKPTDFGLMRLIVQEVDRAVEALRNAGFAVILTEVIAIHCPNRPGAPVEDSGESGRRAHLHRVHVCLCAVGARRRHHQPQRSGGSACKYSCRNIPTSCNEPPAYRQPPMAQTKRRRTFVREVRRRGFIFCANGATVIRHTRLRSETSLSAWRPFSAITSPVLTGLSVRKINIPFPASRNE